MCIRKENPNLPPILEQNKEFNNLIFEFAFTNLNEMSTKFIRDSMR